MPIRTGATAFSSTGCTEAFGLRRIVSSGFDSLFTWDFSKSNYGFNRNDRACAQGRNLRVTERLAKSKRIVIGENEPRRPPQYLEVEGQRPVLDIIKVMVYAMDDLFDAVQCAAITIDLRPAG